MPKQRIEAFFRHPPEKVWRVVTDPVQWAWPGGPAFIEEPRNGRKIVTEDRDGETAVFQITAFAPPRWFAAEVVSRRVTGTCEALLFPERGGTRVEFTADLKGRNAKWELLTRLRLKRWQRYYVESLKRGGLR